MPQGTLTMPSPPHSSIKSLPNYLETLKEFRTYWDLDIDKKPYGEIETLWFRGHKDSSWKLTPKLYRNEFSDADENEIRQEFQSRALQLIQGRIPAYKWEWYFLMQHYGAPTRLLDWTDNPLVALYFAVEDHPGNRDAAVWTLNPWWLNRKLRRGIAGPMLPEWEEADSYLRDLEDAFSGHGIIATLPAAIDPPHVDRRLAAQSSRFVIFGKTRDLMRTKAARATRKNKRHVAMITIPQKFIPNIQADLAFCGITPSLVFPDLQGLCRDICGKNRSKP
jgi:hypothetical protein